MSALTARRLDELVPGQSYTGVVKAVKKIGAFIDIGAPSEGFCHISMLRDGRVEHCRDVVKPGQLVNARVVDVNLRLRRFSLSLQSDKMTEREAASIKRFRGEPGPGPAAPDASAGGAPGEEQRPAGAERAGKRKRSAAAQAARNARRLAKKNALAAA